MRFGIAGVCTDQTHDPGTLAKMVENAGFESMFMGEHTHIPASRESQYPGGPLSPDYSRTYDLFVGLAAAATTTSRIRIGSAICLVPARDPIICANAAASVDRLSGGRLELTAGAGWNLEELHNHGTDAKSRFAVLRERVEAMRKIWAEDEASYDGRFVHFEQIWCWPKPIQKPLPVMLAGQGPKAEDRVFAYGDGWSPVAEPGLCARIRAFKKRAASDGRELPVTVFAVPADARAIEEYLTAGADRCVYWLDSAAAGAAEAEIETFQGAIANAGLAPVGNM